jgi:rhodanese-related sulfurtransferase
MLGVIAMDAIWIDVREYPEFAAGFIEGSQLIPLGTLEVASKSLDKEQPVMLVCRSGRRAEQARQMLHHRGFQSLSVLEGGIEAWQAAEKPLAVVERRPWSLERQVRIVAGLLILMTLAISKWLSWYFLFGTAFVGAGLVFAGLTDTCMMASILRHLPWNRQWACAQGRR